MRPVKVHVLVSREYLLTLHEEQVSLPEQLAPYTPQGCSERHVVYAVLEAMIATAFDAVDEVEVKLDEVSVTSSGNRGGRTRVERLRAMSSRLSGYPTGGRAGAWRVRAHRGPTSASSRDSRQTTSASTRSERS
jgi:Mg2+ and Co2+ transporter CorA